MTKRLKILVDMHCFDQEYQGSYTFVKELYKELVKESSIDFYVAAFDTNKLKATFGEHPHVHYVRYSSRNSFIRLSLLIPALIKKYKIDYAHFQYVTPLFKNCKTIVTIHDVIFDDLPNEFSYGFRKMKKFLYKRSALSADLITTVSDFSKKSIAKHLQIPDQKINIIPNGVSESFFAKNDRQNAKELIRQKFGLQKFILYVSRIEKRKNHAAVCKAFDELLLAEQGYQLVFIGHASEPLQDVVNPSLLNRVKDHLSTLNNIEEEDLIQFYLACEFFVYPSSGEGFGIPPLEAAASGAPVICSNSTAMRAFDFFDPYHFDPNAENDLKTKMQQMIDTGRTDEQLLSVSEKIRQEYSWKKASATFSELLKNAS